MWADGLPALSRLPPDRPCHGLLRARRPVPEVPHDDGARGAVPRRRAEGHAAGGRRRRGRRRRRRHTPRGLSRFLSCGAMPLPTRLTFVALACAALLAVAGCGSDEEEPASSTPEATSTPAATKPEVTVPEGKAPKKLVIEDIEEGTGAAAEPGQTVDVHYVGVSYLNGRQFDASWDRGEPFSFQLGAGSV